MGASRLARMERMTPTKHSLKDKPDGVRRVAAESAPHDRGHKQLLPLECPERVTARSAAQTWCSKVSNSNPRRPDA